MAGWLAGLRAVCVAESDRRHPESVAILVLALLEILTLDEPPAGDDLWSAVYSLVRSDVDAYERFHFGTFGRYLDLATGDTLGGLFMMLGQFGAVTGGSGDAQITPLGRWAVSQLRVGAPEPIDAGLSADELITRLAKLGGAKQVRDVARPWLSARTAVTAAREILTAAAAAPPLSRVVAVDVVSELGEAVLPVWREMADTPGVGPHARAILAAWDDDDGRSAVGLTDRRWLLVESAAAALADAGPDEALSIVYEGMPGSDVDSRVAAVGASGHPDAGALTRALMDFVSSGAPRTVDRVLQVKVTLMRWRPPIWRRVRLPAIATLGELHRVIQVLFGWDGDHLHVFDVGGRQYSDPFFGLDELETGSEFDLRVADAFTPPVKKVTYTYDFGAGWRHEITLEKVVEREPGRRYPVCVAFNGDSPLEYWSEDDPREPVPFDVAAVNRRLAAAEDEDE